MSTIIAGIFDTIDGANDAVDSLVRRGFAQHDLTQFANNPPGQHDQFPIGGDENADPGAKHAHSGAVAGAGVGAGAGAAVGAVVAGPPGAAVGAGIGAYVGSLAGALRGLDGKGSDERPLRRPAGVMIAVRTGDARDEARAIEVLRAEGATHIEKAEGAWRNGTWADFDPVQPPQLLQEGWLERFAPGGAPEMLDDDATANFRVEPDASGKRWHVGTKGRADTSPDFELRQEAVAHAIALAEAETGAVVEVYGRNGDLIWRERYPAPGNAAESRREAVR